MIFHLFKPMEILAWVISSKEGHKACGKASRRKALKIQLRSSIFDCSPCWSGRRSGASRRCVHRSGWYFYYVCCYYDVFFIVNIHIYYGSLLILLFIYLQRKSLNSGVLIHRISWQKVVRNTRNFTVACHGSPMNSTIWRLSPSANAKTSSQCIMLFIDCIMLFNES